MYGERRPEFDPDQVVQNLRQSWDGIRSRLPGGGSRLFILGLIVVAAALWLGTGFYTVQPSEQAALRLFGAFRGTEDEGLHWYPPVPIGRVDVVSVEETRGMELGFMTTAGGVVTDEVVESKMITGDLNIVTIDLVVQYRIKDLGAFLFNVADPGDPARPEAVEGRPDGRTLKDAAEAALRQVVGQRSIDDPLRVGREAVQTDTQDLLQQIVDDYNAGIEILNVQLQEVQPPDQVRDAFDDVNRARVDRESRINESLAYEQDRLPRARGAAEQVTQAAQAFKDARIARAQGEAAEFTAVFTEYALSQEVTRTRLFLEAIEDILPGVTLFILDESTDNVVPFLPLTEDALSSNTGPAAVASGGGG
ncbi:MAG: FtsH protease activity modulator HflK [Chloroflexi bacterium]|nr:FtsH protease activity modulator HflK [Chloroflexota bacterium]